MKRKIFSVLIALVMVLSFSLVTAVSASPGPILGFWQPGDPGAESTVEYSDIQSHSPSYSVYLKALKLESPTDDNKEIYVGEPTGVTTLNDLTSVSFFYYAVEGSDPVPPQIDVWLDTNGTYDAGPPPTGDDQWLLGQFPEVGTWDVWVEVLLSDITWIKGVGGSPVYGLGSDGLDAAKAETDSGTYDTLGECPVLAIGIQVGSTATRATERQGDQEFYIDDFTINAITYDFEAEGSIALTVDIPSITAISVTPTDIDFGTLNPGDASGGTVITISNVGSVAVNVVASLANLDTVFDYLELAGTAPPSAWDGMSIPTSGSDVVSVKLVIPPDYNAKGPETNTLIFTATVEP